MRITIEIGQTKRVGGLEAFSLGMLVPLVLDLLWPRPDVPTGPFEWMAPPAPAPAPERPAGGRLARFMDELMRDLRPQEREVLRRRFGGERPAPAAASEPESPAANV